MGYRRPRFSDLPDIDFSGVEPGDVLVKAEPADLQSYRFAAARFVHAQPLPLTAWTIDHDLGRQPQVTVTDNSGNVVYAEIVHESLNRVVLNFSQSFSGFAYLG